VEKKKKSAAAAPKKKQTAKRTKKQLKATKQQQQQQVVTDLALIPEVNNTLPVPIGQPFFPREVVIQPNIPVAFSDALRKFESFITECITAGSEKLNPTYVSEQLQVMKERVKEQWSELSNRQKKQAILLLPASSTASTTAADVQQPAAAVPTFDFASLPQLPTLSSRVGSSWEEQQLAKMKATGKKYRSRN